MRPSMAGSSVSGHCARCQAGPRWGPRPSGLLEPRAFLVRGPAAASLLGLQTPHLSPHGPGGPMPDPGLRGLQFPPEALAGESVSGPFELLEPPAPLGSRPLHRHSQRGRWRPCASLDLLSCRLPRCPQPGVTLGCWDNPDAACCHEVLRPAPQAPWKWGVGGGHLWGRCSLLHPPAQLPVSPSTLGAGFRWQGLASRSLPLLPAWGSGHRLGASGLPGEAKWPPTTGGRPTWLPLGHVGRPGRKRPPA